MPKLSEVAEINPGVDRSAIKDLNEAVSFVPMASVSEVQGAITSEEERVVSDVLKGFTAFQDRDVLVAKITPCFENGKIAHARIGNRLGFGSTEFHVIRPIASMLDDRYLFHFLRQPVVREEGERRMTGSGGQKRVPKAFLESLDIPVPPLAEQRRIAAILDKADMLCAKRREAIVKLDQLLQAMFLEMFGDPNIEENLGGSKLVPFGDIFEDVSAGHIKTKQEHYLPSGRLAIVDQGQALIGGYTDDLDACSRLELPVIVFGDHTRCVKFVDFPFGVGADGVKVLRAKRRDDVHFLYWWLRLRRIPAAGYSRHFKFLKESIVRVPQLERQRDFSRMAQEVGAQRTMLMTACQTSEKLFRSIQRAVFAGAL